MIKIKKRIISIIIVMLFACACFTSHASISDNDGSAFITKAEFDSLKNNFQSQIDTYNQSIDNKIDAAIAAYLSGINIARETTKQIIFADWDSIECVNEDISNSIGIPYYDVQVIYASMYKGADKWDDNFYIMFDGNNSAKDRSMKINVLEGITVNNTAKTVNTTNAYWCGQSQDVDINVNFKSEWHLSEHSSCYFGDAVGLKFECNDFATWRWSNGWHTTFNDKTNPLFRPYIWRYTTNANWYDVNRTSGVNFTSVVESISLAYDLNNTKHTHILSWTNDRIFETMNKALTTYNKTSKYQSKTSADTISDLNWNNFANAYWFRRGSDPSTDPGTYLYNRGKGCTIVDKTGNPRTGTSYVKQKIPTIGLLPTDLKASQIHQWATTEVRGDGSTPLSAAKLNEGMPLIYVHKDEEITWEPQFSLEFGTGSATTDEVYIELGYGKFSDKNANAEKISFGADTRVKTTSKKGNVKFTATKDGYVWAKWYPAYTTSSAVDSNDWIATLNIAANNTVKVKGDNK